MMTNRLMTAITDRQPYLGHVFGNDVQAAVLLHDHSQQLDQVIVS